MGNRVHIIMAVWGRSYLDLFLDISLPSQLSAQNLPGIAGEGKVIYKIYTMKGDGDYVRSHPAFEKLKNLVECKIIEVDRGDQEDKFSPLMYFHNRAIEEADRENAALIFLSPDFVLADGTLSKVMSLKQEGFRAVMTLTLRMVRETGSEELRDRFYSPRDHTLTISPREMVELGMRHLHSIERSYYWGPGLTSFPIHAYWPVNNEGLLARCFYLHPIMVNPLIRFISPRITIDADYVDRACPTSSDIYVVRDSDELTCFELSQKDMGDANAAIRTRFPVSAWNYAKWAVVNANPFYESLHHHWFFQVPIRVHKGHSSQKWDRVENASQKMARTLRMAALLQRGRAGIGEAIRFYFLTKVNGSREQSDAPEKPTLPIPFSGAEGLDLQLYEYARDKLSPEYSHILDRWFAGASKKEDVDRCYSESFVQADVHTGKRIRICLAEEIFGTGWGKAEWNDHGQRWRFLGPDGKARLYLSVQPRGSYVLKTLVHTAPPEVVNKLEVEVNGRKAAEQQIMNRRGIVYHWCILPEDAVGVRRGRLEVVYRVRGNGRGDQVALGEVVCRPLKWYQTVRYREFRRRLGR